MKTKDVLHTCACSKYPAIKRKWNGKYECADCSRKSFAKWIKSVKVQLMAGAAAVGAVIYFIAF